MNGRKILSGGKKEWVKRNDENGEGENFSEKGRGRSVMRLSEGNGIWIWDEMRWWWEEGLGGDGRGGYVKNFKKGWGIVRKDWGFWKKRDEEMERN